MISLSELQKLVNTKEFSSEFDKKLQAHMSVLLQNVNEELRYVPNEIGRAS